VPTALITGVSGQDGSYLAEFLLARDYRVVGTTRDVQRALSSPFATALVGVELHQVPPAGEALVELARREKPDEVYHLAAPSSVAASWKDPAGTQSSIVLPVAALAAWIAEELPSPRFFLAGSAEVFGPEERAQDESSPRAPTTPYGHAKLEAMEIVEHVRKYFGVYAVTGVLFNHESPRKGAAFVTRKIARAAARIALGEQQELQLGNVDVRRDWGFAGDYVKAMWLMMFQEEPEDLVIGTGVARSVADFCEAAFRHVGLDWLDHVRSDPSLVRRGDAPLRLANPARAKARLGWTPEVDFGRLVAMMVDYEMGEGRRETGDV
jgi:GDPmannose 4,6-dehydratase